MLVSTNIQPNMIEKPSTFWRPYCWCLEDKKSKVLWLSSLTFWRIQSINNFDFIQSRRFIPCSWMDVMNSKYGNLFCSFFLGWRTMFGCCNYSSGYQASSTTHWEESYNPRKWIRFGNCTTTKIWKILLNTTIQKELFIPNLKIFSLLY